LLSIFFNNKGFSLPKGVFSSVFILWPLNHSRSESLLIILHMSNQSTTNFHVFRFLNQKWFRINTMRRRWVNPKKDFILHYLASLHKISKQFEKTAIFPKKTLERCNFLCSHIFRSFNPGINAYKDLELVEYKIILRYEAGHCMLLLL
jgi:hypothetical protein